MFHEREQYIEKTTKYFHLSLQELRANNLDLHFDRYRKYDENKVKVRPPNEILDAIMNLEKEIMKDLNNLNSMI